LVITLLRRLSFHLTGAQIGITVSALLLGLVAEDAFGESLAAIPGINEGGISVAVVSLLVATMLHMVLGELVPKNLAITKPEPVASALSPALMVFGTVAAPAIKSFEATANWVVRRLGIEPSGKLQRLRSLDELAYVIKSSAAQGTLADGERLRLERVLRFGDRDVADVLVPRTDMVVVAHDATLSELTELSLTTGRSRFPVVGKNLDDLRGVVEVAQLLAVEPELRSTVTVGELMVEALIVPEGRPLDRLLSDFTIAKSRFAVVVDEHGGVAGLITLEDLLEELVGEINDEYDEDDAVTHTQRAGRLEIDGRTHIDEVGDLIGAELPDGPYETVAGLVLAIAGRVPAVGEIFSDGTWQFEVLAADHRRITRVAVTRVRPGRTT